MPLKGVQSPGWRTDRCTCVSDGWMDGFGRVSMSCPCLVWGIDRCNCSFAAHVLLGFDSGSDVSCGGPDCRFLWMGSGWLLPVLVCQLLELDRYMW
jgi:hypothetical protein